MTAAAAHTQRQPSDRRDINIKKKGAHRAAGSRAGEIQPLEEEEGAEEAPLSQGEDTGEGARLVCDYFFLPLEGGGSCTQ